MFFTRVLYNKFSFSNFIVLAFSFSKDTVMLASLLISSSYESTWSTTLSFDTLVSPYDMRQCSVVGELVVASSSWLEYEPTSSRSPPSVLEVESSCATLVASSSTLSSDLVVVWSSSSLDHEVEQSSTITKLWSCSISSSATFLGSSSLNLPSSHVEESLKVRLMDSHISRAVSVMFTCFIKSKLKASIRKQQACASSS